jgi:hypothetical protein
MTRTEAGANNAFSTILVSGQEPVIANTSGASFSLVAGTGVSLTTTPESDAVTVSSEVGVPWGELDGSTVTVQNTSENSDTHLKIRPTGTGEFSSVTLSSEPSGSNESLFSASVGNNYSELTASKSGTGVTKPILVSVDGTSVMLIEKTKTTHYTGVTIGKTNVGTPTASDGNVYSGTHNPSFESGTNCTALGVWQGPWMFTRIGSIVTVTGMVLVSATVIGTAFFKVSLPVAANAGSEERLAGVISGPLNPYGSCAGIVRGTSGDIGYAYVEIYIPKEHPYGPICGITFSYLV